MTNLSYLSLEGCMGITDDALSEIRHCRKLCWINASRTRLGDKVLYFIDLLLSYKTLEICGKLPRLTSLNINGCQHVTNRGIFHLAKQKCQLETLCLSQCKVRAGTRNIKSSRM